MKQNKPYTSKEYLQHMKRKQTSKAFTYNGMTKNYFTIKSLQYSIQRHKALNTLRKLLEHGGTIN